MVKDIMTQNIALSEIITIDSEENRCAIAFAMELQHHLQSPAKTLFLTANNPELVRTNLEVIKAHLPDFDTIHQNTIYLFLKEHWSELQDRYGIRTFVHELQSIVQDEAYEIFYFHRIDLFFDKQFTPEVEEAVIALLESVRYHHKKIFLSYNTQNVTGKSFDRLFQDKRDLSFDVVTGSDGECDLTMKTHNRLLKKEYASILLISDQHQTRRLHQIIMQNEPGIRLDLVTLEDLHSGNHTIDPQTDLILYNDSRKLLDKEMADTFRKLAPYTQIFWLTNQKSIRKSDLSESRKMGIDQLFPKHFDIQEYFHAIEQIIQNQFYTHKLDNLSYLGQSQVVDIRELTKRIAELQEKHVLFTSVTVNAAHIQRENISSLIRKEDFAFIDQANNIVLFVLINLPEESARQIIASRINVNPLMVIPQKNEEIAKLFHEGL